MHFIDGYAGGDPHYRTFDGKSFDFMGKCEYIYAKDCSIDHAFEVLQQNEACGRSASCTKSIRVLVQGIEVKMERRGIVYVDGIRVKLPWKMSPTLPPAVENDISMDGISMNNRRSVSGNKFSAMHDHLLNMTTPLSERTKLICSDIYRK